MPRDVRDLRQNQRRWPSLFGLAGLSLGALAGALAGWLLVR